jgi:hypothetical protein
VVTYVEPGGSWRPVWIAAAAVGLVVGFELLLPGSDLPGGMFALLGVAFGIVVTGSLQARRIWTVRVDDDALSVGRERVRLSEIDVAHLREVDSGVDAGAPVLGGGWSLPKGRTGLPLKLTDGRTVLVPTRNPAALYEALMTGVGGTRPGTPDRPPGSQGTLGS